MEGEDFFTGGRRPPRNISTGITGLKNSPVGCNAFEADLLSPSSSKENNIFGRMTRLVRPRGMKLPSRQPARGREAGNNQKGLVTAGLKRLRENPRMQSF
jgi:hypothetical protein